MPSSCDIEDFVETHLSLRAVCDTPVARITGCVSSLRIQYAGHSPWNYSVNCTRVNRVMLISLCDYVSYICENPHVFSSSAQLSVSTW